MRSHELPCLQEWDDFDRLAETLIQLGWNARQKIDGPDARSWLFIRVQQQIWLVFDDVLCGSLKTDDDTVDLKAIVSQLECAK